MSRKLFHRELIIVTLQVQSGMYNYGLLLLGIMLVTMCLGTAVDVPFIFDESSSDLASLTPDKLQGKSTSSPELAGVPAISTTNESEVIEISETGGGGGAVGTIKRTVEELRTIFDERVDFNNDIVRLKALVVTANFSGDRTIDQICAIYDYMKKGGGSIREWSYKSDPRGGDLYQYANFTLRAGAAGGCVGMGDCDDFAILMAALIESIGGTSRVVLAYNKTEGHAYTEIYLGRLDDVDSQVEPIIKWLKQEYETTKIFTHIETTTKEVWLNLDWGPENRSGIELFHPGGPFFQGDKHIVLRIREKARKTFLRVPEGYEKLAIMPPNPEKEKCLQNPYCNWVNDQCLCTMPNPEKEQCQENPSCDWVYDACYCRGIPPVDHEKESCEQNPECSYVNGHCLCRGLNPPESMFNPLEDNTDRPGMDMRSFDMSDPLPEQCAQACAEDADCKAFTYLKPGYQGPTARCWLKSGVPDATYDARCISGVKKQTL